MSKKFQESFTGLHNREILEVVPYFKFASSERSFLDVLWRETYGRKSQSLNGLANGKEMYWNPIYIMLKTGIKTPELSNIKKRLTERNVIGSREDGNIIWFKKNYMMWDVPCRIDPSIIAEIQETLGKFTSKDTFGKTAKFGKIPKNLWENFQQTLGNLPTTLGKSPKSRGDNDQKSQAKTPPKERKESKERKERASTSDDVLNQPAFKVDHIGIVKAYNANLASVPGSPFNPVYSWEDDKERKRLRDRCLEDKVRETLPFWNRFFRYVAASDYLMGDKAPWNTLAQLIRKGTMAKILNGNYHGASGQVGEAGPMESGSSRPRRSDNDAYKAFLHDIMRKEGYVLENQATARKWDKLTPEEKEKYYEA